LSPTRHPLCAVSVDRELGEVESDAALHAGDAVEQPERGVAEAAGARPVKGRHAVMRSVRATTWRPLGAARAW
jgi:hypothetical protein